MLYGKDPADLIDHRDGNGLNNKKSNLRLATGSQNNYNQQKSSTNSSGVKGVTWNANLGKWQAQLQVNKKYHYVGVYSDIEKAAAAVQAVRRRLHREFARHA